MSKLILPLIIMLVIACSRPKVEYEYYYYSAKRDSMEMDRFVRGKAVVLTFVNGERYNFKSDNPSDDTTIFKLYPDLQLVSKEIKGKARIIEIEK